MSSSPQKTLKIVCSHCQVEFAIAPKADLAGNLEIPCPSCWAVVAVPADALLRDSDAVGPDQQWQSGRAVVHAKRAWNPRGSEDADKTMEIEVNPKTTLPVGSSASTYPVTVSVDVTILSPGTGSEDALESEARPGLESFLGDAAEPAENIRMPFFRNTLNVPAVHATGEGRPRASGASAPDSFSAPPPKAALMQGGSKAKLKAVLKKIKTGLAADQPSAGTGSEALTPGDKAASGARKLRVPRPTRPTNLELQAAAADATTPAVNPDPEGGSGTMRLHAVARNSTPTTASKDGHVDLRSRMKALRSGRNKVIKRHSSAEIAQVKRQDRPVEVKPDRGRKAGLVSDQYPAKKQTPATVTDADLAAAAPNDTTKRRSTGLLHRVEPGDIASAQAAQKQKHGNLRAMLAEVKLRSQAGGDRKDLADEAQPAHQPTLIGMRAPGAEAIERAKAESDRQKRRVGDTATSGDWPSASQVTLGALAPGALEPEVTERDLEVGVDVDRELENPLDERQLADQLAMDGRVPSTPGGLGPDSSGDWQEIPLSESGLWDTSQLTGEDEEASAEAPQSVTVELPQVTVGESPVGQTSASAEARAARVREDSVQIKLSALTVADEGPDTDVVAQKRPSSTDKPDAVPSGPAAADPDRDDVAVIAQNDVVSPLAARPKPAVRKLRFLLWGAAALSLLTAVGLGLRYTELGAFAHKAWLVPVAGGHLATLGDQTEARFQKHAGALGGHGAIRAASRVVADAVGPSPDQAEGISRLAGALVEAGKPNRARKLLERAIGRGIVSRDVTLKAVGLLVDENRPRRARELAWKAIDLRGAQYDLIGAVNTSIAADKKFAPPTLDLVKGRDFASIERSRLAKRLSLSLSSKTGQQSTFLPALSDKQGSEIAPIVGWRLCQYMRCPLEVPYSQDARVSGDVLTEVTGAAAWSSELAITDGQVAGAYGPSALDGVGLPIEYVDAWQPWLALDVTPGILDQPAADNLGAMGSHGRQRDLSRALAGKKVAWLAEQISAVILLDFLMGNGARFQSEERNYGRGVKVTATGVQIAEFAGAFEADPDLARRRLERVERFSLRQTTSLRALDRASAGRWLFTREGQVDAERLKAFWTRRQVYLRYVDALRQRSREDKVLSLP